MAGWVERARAELKRKGWTNVELASRIGYPTDNVNKWLQGRVDQPRGDAMSRMADAFGIHETWLRSGVGPHIKMLPVVGYTSAGETWIPIDDGIRGASLDEIEFDLRDADPIAILVRSNSMIPVYRPGDHLICSRTRGLERSSIIGKDCAVRTRDGRGFIKRITRGSRDGVFTLRSYNLDYDDQVDVELDWAAPVVWIRRT